MKKKTLLIIIQILIVTISFAQEFNVGGNIGFGLIDKSNKPFLGGSIEYRMSTSLISFNSDPFILISDKKVILTEPIYIKFIIGKKVRICPDFGGFIRTNSHYGWLSGLVLEYKIKEKLILDLRGDYYKDYWKSEIPSHFGSTQLEKNSEGSFLISFGIKRRIK